MTIQSLISRAANYSHPAGNGEYFKLLKWSNQNGVAAISSGSGVFTSLRHHGSLQIKSISEHGQREEHHLPEQALKTY
jgi:hypothetical protein